ncbi:hypothetical protein CSA56_09475 [candidate division KSB3 bacterium]|uniref:Uncharacterized protein n=1 Tax=candidate division KSB3 bacterium TaxID=2044937 RepID=A0A2G6KGG5_9BACT|nr:MAG: hypothetical protein CSA56_09475 [candidate division KSB3 bacterium]
MVNARYITCYLCERENRIPTNISRTSEIRCGACSTLLVDIIHCPSCGTKNRVKIRFVEHQHIACGKCQTLLRNHKVEPVLIKPSRSKRSVRNALALQGKLHQWKGEWETAISFFQRAQKHQADTSRKTAIFVSIGLCYAYLGSYEKAKISLEQLDDIELSQFSVMYELARAYGLVGDLDLSIVCFENAQELLADQASIQQIEGLLDTLYDIRDATNLGTEALQTAILLYDARQDFETDNLQAGVQKLQRALDIAPAHAEIYQQLGIGLLQLGQFEDAIAMLEHGLEFDPMNEQAQFALGDAYFHLGMYECALNAYKQTLNLNPRHIDAYHHLGLIYEQQGEPETAKGYWEDVLQVLPEHKEAIRCLIRCQ